MCKSIFYFSGTSQLEGKALLRLPLVLGLVGVSRATWYRGVRAGSYPAPVKPSSRVSAWRADDIAKLLDGFTLSFNKEVGGHDC